MSVRPTNQPTPSRNVDNPRVARDPLREEEHESRWEAAPAVLLVIALQLLLALVSRQQDWVTWIFHWWVWLIPVVPEALLLAALALDAPRHQLEQMGMRREVALTLFAVVTVANAFLLVAVIASLLRGEEKSGAQLLLKAACVWGTNVIAFGLWYWGLDRGGPVTRREPGAPLPDFQFPQMENPQFAPANWLPALYDYMYVSFTNAVAFSPTDAMPLTRRAKLLMLVESAVSSLTLLLVAARAVNIFK
jgi:uncharacterized membrane protein